MRKLLMLLIVAFVPAERHLHVPLTNDLERFHGVWVLTHADLEFPQLANAMLNNQVIIAGNEYQRFPLDGSAIVMRTFRLHPDTNPKGIDLIANETGQELIYKGIYEFKDDTFRFCFALSGNERPREFRIGPNSTANSVTTYRFVKRMK